MTTGVLRRFAGSALDLVLPPRCPACREIVSGADEFCSTCWQDLTFITAPQCAACGLPFDIEQQPGALCGACAGQPRPYRHARAAVAYQGTAIPVILGFKHGDRTHLARMMARQMLRLLPAFAQADLLVPVPLDRARLRMRGYNQAALLARALARSAGLETDVAAMDRVKPTRSTAGLSRSARFRAASGAFAAERNRVEGRRVVIVDDVMTTGATGEAAAKALMRAGARSVDVLTYARAFSSDI